jgi:hypothetical protein
MNSYKITIECTSWNDLCYNDESLENLITKFDYIKKAWLLYKTYKNELKISLEFMCESANEISESQFKSFIETMRASDFYSSNDKTICLIKITDSYQIIYKYHFQSLAKQKIEQRIKKNKSSYRTITLYDKPNILALRPRFKGGALM